MRAGTGGLALAGGNVAGADDDDDDVVNTTGEGGLTTRGAGLVVESGG